MIDTPESTLPNVTAPAPGRDPNDTPLLDPSLQVLVALRERIAMDPKLRGASLRVLIYLLPELLDRRHRVVKGVALAKTLRLNQNHAAWTLRALVASGHLERGPDEGSLRTYRLAAHLLSHFR